MVAQRRTLGAAAWKSLLSTYDRYKLLQKGRAVLDNLGSGGFATALRARLCR
jgi:hypothetical protein